MQRELVRGQQVAASAAAFTFDLSQGSDLLVLDVTAHADVSPDALEAAVVHEVDRLQQGDVDAVEVQRAVTLTTTEFVTTMQSAQSRADRLSQFATYLNDPHALNQQVALLEAVDLVAVRQFAGEWLGQDNRASLMYVPRAVASS
jgi:predicted Zn-dependent peptidase